MLVQSYVTYLQCILLISLPSPDKQHQIQSEHTAHGYYNSYIPCFWKASHFSKYFVKINGIRRHEQLTPKRSQMITQAVNGIHGCRLSHLLIVNEVLKKVFNTKNPPIDVCNLLSSCENKVLPSAIPVHRTYHLS